MNSSDTPPLDLVMLGLPGAPGPVSKSKSSKRNTVTPGEPNPAEAAEQSKLNESAEKQQVLLDRDHPEINQLALEHSNANLLAAVEDKDKSMES